MTYANLIKELHRCGFHKDIVQSFEKVDRALFVPKHLQEYAYNNEPLPLASGSTISQPTTIAFMIDILDTAHAYSIAEVGSGSGYVIALLSEHEPSAHIVGYEINESLVKIAESALKKYKNCVIHSVSGFKMKGKYDRILVSAEVQEEKDIEFFKSHLTPQGVLVVPYQSAILRYDNASKRTRTFPGFAFVPLSN